MARRAAEGTLRYFPNLCNHCGMCATVCPYGVFAAGSHEVRVARPGVCIECGACQRNCPAGAVRVEGGGCTAERIISVLFASRERPVAEQGRNCGEGRRRCP